MTTELPDQLLAVPDHTGATLDLRLARGNPLRRLLVVSKGRLEITLAAHGAPPDDLAGWTVRRSPVRGQRITGCPRCAFRDVIALRRMAVGSRLVRPPQQGGHGLDQPALVAVCPGSAVATRKRAHGPATSVGARVLAANRSRTSCGAPASANCCSRARQRSETSCSPPSSSRPASSIETDRGERIGKRGWPMTHIGSDGC